MILNQVKAPQETVIRFYKQLAAFDTYEKGRFVILQLATRLLEWKQWKQAVELLEK